MNFFGHAVVGLRHSDDRRFLLGTMLPDLCAMLGIRISRAHDAAIATGVDFHHRTDAAFHGSARFVTLCSNAVESLTEAGVSRGTARAVAHVGTELLLDGMLSRETDARPAYADALAYAVEERLSERLPTPHEAQARLHRGLTRLVNAPIPEAYLDPAFVVDRLEAMLAPRPRLAMQARDVPLVRHELDRLHGEVSTTWRELLAQVQTRLELTEP